MSSFDPKELKILSDILALVLEDQAGQSEAALEAIRSRAKRNGTTGGALKNLFTAIAPDPPKSRASTTTRTRTTRSAAGNAEVQQARQQIRELTEGMNRLDRELREARASNASLRAELFLTQQARAEMQTEFMNTRSSAGPRLLLITLSFIVGCATGIATTGLYNALWPARPVDKAIYLR
ncbi:hypothetical protein LOC54_10495 [Acetobacter sp. AN02]|uniref:hypothetical protein n=1 Tax=Acetobacter sp. AN02 TaxID=2894186 RepID=UPI002434637C|nr:hypothetical protein [Acetobacter sp. AN02]MDG6095522.1 hypothetical protein [Acetobacter sp. AN02]